MDKHETRGQASELKSHSSYLLAHCTLATYTNTSTLYVIFSIRNNSCGVPISEIGKENYCEVIANREVCCSENE
eukprot:m.42765 g.42765  ORF g.42765 m.42765 type:complete len:74 (+) comp33385_c0_seq2:373-594(+)